MKIRQAYFHLCNISQKLFDYRKVISNYSQLLFLFFKLFLYLLNGRIN